MAKSCCSDCSPQAARIEGMIHTETKETGQKLPDAELCCEDGPCACDDNCFEEYALTICKNDAEHIHHDKNPTPAANKAGIEIHDKECTETNCSSAPCCKSISDSTLLSPEAVVSCTATDTRCATGCAFASICQRTTRSPPPPYAEASPQGPAKQACGQHISFARSRYATLSAFGCICKAFLAHGLQSCCTKTQATKGKKPTRATVRFSKATAHGESSKTCAPSGRGSQASCCKDSDNCKSASRSSINSCGQESCCSGRDKHSSAKGSRASLDSHCGQGDCSGNKGSQFDARSQRSVDSCCGKGNCSGDNSETTHKVPATSSFSAGDCCGDRDTCKLKSHVSIDSCCKDSCCDGPENSAEGCCNSEFCEELPLDVTPSALEKGLGKLEHAVLAVKGMTCTGCENKLIRGLQAIPAITHVKTSLVLCRAEFDYDNSNTLEAVVDVLSKRTGFSIEIMKGTSVRGLPLIVDRALQEAFLSKEMLKGVEAVSRASKDAFAVLYDPRLIGARKILEGYAEFTPELAPEPLDPALTTGASHIRALAVRVSLSAMLTIPVLVMTWAPLPPNPHAYAIASLALATIVQVAITGPVYVAAFKSLFFSHLVETDMLVVLSTTAAYVYSVVAFAYSMVGHPLPSGEFFETSTLLVTLIMLGQLVSAYARQRAMEAISIRSLQSTTAALVHPDGREEVIDARLLQYGDTFKVVPDSSFITDGTIVSGNSSVDESMMTGESRPVDKNVGDTVVAGTLNGGGTLLVTLTRLPGENTIADIAGMVDDARFSRAKLQATVDKVCSWFVPVVLAVTVITFIVWLAVGLRVRGQPSGQAAVAALTYAIAVLAISCPCAIGLAVPMVILVAGGVAARHGLVFKAATTIEVAREITHVVFDKTGTLTQGKMEVVSATYPDVPAGLDVQAAVRELVAGSKHPVAHAVEAFLAEPAVCGDLKVADIQAVTGRGIRGVLDESLIQGGSPAWLNMTSNPAVAPLLSEGLTVFCVSLTRGSEVILLAVFALSDVLRPEAGAVVATLSAKHVRTSILSGDHYSAVARIAAPLNIPTERLYAGCLPGEKKAYIKELEARGEKVLFVGDGTNDAAALAQATIGVHLHTAATSNGATVSAASSAADVVLTHPSLTGLLTLLELSEAVHHRIVLNFAWSAVYNLVAILFASGAFVNARIAPAYAGLGEVVSVLPVVVVAMMLRLFKPKA